MAADPARSPRLTGAGSSGHGSGAMVRAATGQDVTELAKVLGRAFQDDPVARWIEPDEARRRHVLPKVYAMQLQSLFAGQGVAEVAVSDGSVRAGALWNPPGRWRTPARTQLRLLPTALRLAGRRIGRVMALSRAVEAEHPAAPHWYLAELGTDPRAQRTGLGALLLASGLTRADAAGQAVYLEAPETNIAYYERFGFEVTGEIRIPGGPTVYPMWRAPKNDPKPETHRLPRHHPDAPGTSS